MKFKLGAAAIVFASLSFIAGLSYLVDRISKMPQASETQEDENDEVYGFIKNEANASKRLASLQEFIAEDLTPNEEEKMILEVAELEETALQEELLSLAKRMEEEQLFAKLESKHMNSQKTVETKALIERFTLLGLEQTRRKYLFIEPELKDAIYAHRDSLKDIRGLLARY